MSGLKMTNKIYSIIVALILIMDVFVFPLSVERYEGETKFILTEASAYFVIIPFLFLIWLLINKNENNYKWFPASFILFLGATFYCNKKILNIEKEELYHNSYITYAIVLPGETPVQPGYIKHFTFFSQDGKINTGMVTIMSRDQIKDTILIVYQGDHPHNNKVLDCMPTDSCLSKFRNGPVKMGIEEYKKEK